MTKQKNKKSIERITLEDISPKFEEKQAVIDACASDTEIMREYISNGTLSEAFDGYSHELKKAKEKYRKMTGEILPAEKEDTYLDSFLKVSRKLTKFYGFNDR
ncbi:MAG: hypothetical protein ACOCP4_03810 [Candidatus Woesearchaeota archaeon]